MAYQTSLASRVEFLEKSLGDSAVKHVEERAPESSVEQLGGLALARPPDDLAFGNPDKEASLIRQVLWPFKGTGI